MIQNSQFMNMLAANSPAGSYLWWTAFGGNPTAGGQPWGGQEYDPDDENNWIDQCAEVNSYYSVAALTASQDGRNRRKENFARLLVLVADDPDISALDGKASFILQTSPGKHQVGFVIDPDDADASDYETVDGVLKSMARAGLISMDKSGNNAVRYCRLPVGTNGKYDDPFEHQLLQFTGEVFRLLDAASILGVDLKNAEQAQTKSREYKDQGSKLDESIAAIVSGSELHDSLLIISGSFVASGMDGGACVNALRSLMKMSKRKITDYPSWIARYNDIPRLVDGAQKFEKEKILPAVLNTDYDVNPDVLSPVEFVIDGFISNKITVIAGPPGVGKTSLLVPLSFHAAHLCDELSPLRPILRRRVIYITEDADQVGRIIYGICKNENVKKPKEGYNYWFRVIHASRKPYEELAEMIREIREQHSLNLGPEFDNYIVEPLIVLDTSNATLELENENDNAQVGRAIAKIKESMGKCAIWIVAHTSKGGGKDGEQLSARGAGAFEGDANAVAYLINDKGQRYLTLGKRRFECDYDTIKFESYASSETVRATWGEEQHVRYRYGIPIKSSSSERQSAKESQDEARFYSIRGAILDALANKGDMNTNDLCDSVPFQRQDVIDAKNELVRSGQITEKAGSRNAKIYHVANPRPYYKKD